MKMQKKYETSACTRSFKLHLYVCDYQVSEQGRGGFTIQILIQEKNQKEKVPIYILRLISGLYFQHEFSLAGFISNRSNYLHHLLLHHFQPLPGGCCLLSLKWQQPANLFLDLECLVWLKLLVSN